jgi:cysteine desulfurase
VFGQRGQQSSRQGFRRRAGAGLEARFVASAIEHPCVDQALRQVAGSSAGRFALEWVQPRADGAVSADSFEPFLAPPTRFATLMLANNETGAVQPVEAVGRLCRERGVFFHVDACQALGRMDLSRLAESADSITLCAHKAYGPKGAAALIVDPEAPLRAQIAGGGQEGGRRAGTENVAAIVGFGAACALAARDCASRAEQARACEEALLAGLDARGLPYKLALERGANLAGILNLAMEGLDSEELLVGLDLEGIAISTGAACSSGAIEPSRVLAAMGFPRERIRRSARFSAGLACEPAEMERVAAVVEMLAFRKSAATLAGS